MHYLVNELSFIGQAINTYEATDLMVNMYEIIKIIELGKIHHINVHSTFWSCQLSDNLNIDLWAKYLQSQANQDNKLREISIFFLILYKKEPYIDHLLTDLSNCECEYKGSDVSLSSIAGAAYRSGALVSLQKSPEFESKTIQAVFSHNGISKKTVNIPNIINSIDLEKLRRNYVPSPKHSTRGGPGTFMDLPDDVAQIVLEQGISDRTQVYNYYNGTFYKFQCTEKNEFHGYPIPNTEREIPFKVSKQLLERINENLDVNLNVDN
jgi:hypothetical protein